MPAGEAATQSRARQRAIPLPHALRVLRHRDLRLFFAGQAISLVGTWMQSVAQSWLVYRLTGSAALLGLVYFLSQAPVFLLGMLGGAVADRHARRDIVMLTQLLALGQAFTMSVLTFGGWIQAWHLLSLASVLGIVNAFEIPARQAMLGELAGEDVPNAVALNSTLVNTARVLGPALAGYLVGAVGEAWCFFINALSFLAVLIALRAMAPRPAPAANGAQEGPLEHLRGGILYARDKRLVRALLLLLAISSFFGVPYTSLLPVFAADVHHGGPELLGRFFGSAGAGALVSAMTLLTRRHLGGLARRVGFGATALGLGLLTFSLARSTGVAQACLFVVGFGFIQQMAGTMTLLQGLTPGELRGRVVGLFTTLFVGVSPFGGLLAGWAASIFTAPRALFAGALVVLIASAAFHLALPSIRRVLPEQHPMLFPPQPPP
jgi:MFS family permease